PGPPRYFASLIATSMPRKKHSRSPNPGACGVKDRQQSDTTVEVLTLFHPLLELPQPPFEETPLVRVLDVPMLQQPAEEDARGLQLVHVLQDEDLHVPRPRRHIARGARAVDRGGIAQRQGQVLQPMLGEHG